MARWQYRLRISVPGRPELIDAAWNGQEVSESLARGRAVQAVREMSPFMACTTDDDQFFIVVRSKIQWIRIETKEVHDVT